MNDPVSFEQANFYLNVAGIVLLFLLLIVMIVVAVYSYKKVSVATAYLGVAQEYMKLAVAEREKTGRVATKVIEKTNELEQKVEAHAEAQRVVNETQDTINKDGV